ncbi:MAG: 4-hydroxy-tetrahydrodipicolinate synthase [Clostridiales bacterium]|nr:4-hydroxy-tetrahydrodipicolinate synthase [Clostridiales bacterium]
MKKPLFTGSGTALVTPFHADGSVNYEAFDRQLEFQLANGTDALFVCVTTSETPTLSQSEYEKLVRMAVEKGKGRVPVVAGAGSNNTAHSLELALCAGELGADAVLLVTPYYNKASQAGLVRHFTHVVDNSKLPALLYNVPSRTGCNIKPETYRELANHPKIIGTKEAGGDISAIAETIALCGDDLPVFSGNDNQVLPILALGGKGVVSVFTNILPRQMHDIVMGYLEGDKEQSRRQFLEWLDLMNALFFDVNPIPVKEAMNLMGMEAGPCRLPLTEMGAAQKEKMVAVMKKHGLI